MRIHRLEVEAFGPFAERVVVDFDDLTDAGLFLVHGPTGAGKTSLLDAVCFALYAGVPGSRSAGATLRSHHAPEGAVPSVVLELTAAGRRLRITRQPAYLKPKRAHPVPAKVVLEEQRRGAWEVLTTRHEEVGDVVKDVMGMGRRQFERVVVLPQGEFAAFLRAKAEERRAVLESLFDVSTFTDVEGWLADQRRTLAAAVDGARAGLVRATGALADLLSHRPGPAALDGSDQSDPGVQPPVDGSDQSDPGVHEAVLLEAQPAPERLAEVLPRVEGRLEEAMTAALVAEEEASLAAQEAQTAHAEAQRLAAAQDKGARARAAERQLAESADLLARARNRLGEAERAAPVRGHLEAERAAARRLEATRRDLVVALTSLPIDGVDPQEPQDGARLLREVHAFDTTVEEIERLVRDVETEQVAATRGRTEAATLRARSEALAMGLTELAERLDAVTAQQTALVASAAALPALAAAHEQARRRLDLRRAVDRCAGDLETAADVVRSRTSAEQTAREAYLDLREARLDGMAAELAAGLLDDAPCLVCGSTSHPLPATPVGAVVTADDVAEAERVHQQLAAARAEAQARLAGLQGARDARLLELDGDERDEDALAAAVSEAAAAVSRARAAEDALTDLEARVEDARRGLEAAQRQRLETAEAAGAALATAAGHEERLRDAQARLAASVARHAAECPCSTTDSSAGAHEPREPQEPHMVVDRHAAVRHALEIVVRHLAEAAEAEQRLAELRETFEAVLVEAGFADADAVRSALLPADDLTALRERVRQHDEALVRVRATLDDPDVAAALDTDPANLVAAAARRDEAVDGARLAARRLADAESTLQAGRRLLVEIRGVLDALAPLLERQRVVTEVADAVTGSGANTLKMPLSSYVLAARLERVAELANERLAVMGDGRFELRHTDDRSGNARSGLGLEVVDLWTGRPRATSTLSGGESFMASLALALGLADAVREEAGGIDLQTLFVDEGFGTLDDESLEQVMTVLDSLRDGGRAVGIVSHVADLRQRIPRQLRVTKTPRGSSASVVELAPTG